MEGRIIEQGAKHIHEIEGRAGLLAARTGAEASKAGHGGDEAIRLSCFAAIPSCMIDGKPLEPAAFPLHLVLVELVDINLAEVVVHFSKFSGGSCVVVFAQGERSWVDVIKECWMQRSGLDDAGPDNINPSVFYFVCGFQVNHNKPCSKLSIRISTLHHG